MKNEPPEPRLKINNIFIKLLEKLFSQIKSKKDLAKLLQHAEQNDLIDSDELRIIEGTLKIAGMKVREIMVPRAKITAVQENQDLKSFLPQIINSAHSRFPVMNEEGTVIGILLAKDLLPYVNQTNGKFDLQKVLRPPIHIPESKRLDVLLDEFRRKRIHMAIVQNEFGLTAGLVTIEDVLEEIVGEIEDEHDNIKNKDFRIVNIPFEKNAYRVKGDTKLEEFNKYFTTDITHEDADSIGGIIINNLQRMPKKGDKVTIGNMEFEVIKQDKKRTEELRLTILK